MTTDPHKAHNALGGELEAIRSLCYNRQGDTHPREYQGTYRVLHSQCGEISPGFSKESSSVRHPGGLGGGPRCE